MKEEKKTRISPPVNRPKSKRKIDVPALDFKETKRVFQPTAPVITKFSFESHDECWLKMRDQFQINASSAGAFVIGMNSSCDGVYDTLPQILKKRATLADSAKSEAKESHQMKAGNIFEPHIRAVWHMMLEKLKDTDHSLLKLIQRAAKISVGPRGDLLRSFDGKWEPNLDIYTSSKVPTLGATPDGLIFSAERKIVGVVEVKHSTKYRDGRLADMIIPGESGPYLAHLLQIWLQMLATDAAYGFLIYQSAELTPDSKGGLGTRDKLAFYAVFMDEGLRTSLTRFVNDWSKLLRLMKSNPENFDLSNVKPRRNKGDYLSDFVDSLCRKYPAFTKESFLSREMLLIFFKNNVWPIALIEKECIGDEETYSSSPIMYVTKD